MYKQCENGARWVYLFIYLFPFFLVSKHFSVPLKKQKYLYLFIYLLVFKSDVIAQLFSSTKGFLLSRSFQNPLRCLF